MKGYGYIYSKIQEITQGNYSLSCSEPLTEVKTLIVLIYHYEPRKEDNIYLRDRALEQLRKWKKDLRPFRRERNSY